MLTGVRSPATPASTSLSYVSDLWRIALVLAALYYALLGGRPLANPDEGRYTEIPREMVATGDYTTPRLNGVKYFEKPPLLYWLTAGAIRVFGITEFAARFWPATFGMLGGLITYAAGRALYDRLTGIFAATVLSTCLLYYGLSRLALLDVAVSVLMSAALFAFIVALDRPPGWPRRGLFWAFYASMALAVLTKGLIGLVLPCAIAGLWVLLLNRWSRLRPFYPFSGTLLLLAIAAPWHVLAAQANSDFLYFYFVHEHFLRFTTKIHDRYEPWWYFGPILLAGFFPWVAFLFQSLRQSLAGGWKARRENQTAWYLVIWAVFIFLFFSKSQSKLAPYILPLFPALAVVLGRYLATAWQEPEKRSLRSVLAVLGGLFLVLGVALPLVKIVRDPGMLAELQPWRLLLTGLFIGMSVVVGSLAFRRKTRAALVAIAAGMAAILLALNPAMAAVDKRSTKPFAQTIKAQLQPGDRVYAFRNYFQDLPVYLGQTIDVVGYVGEMEFGVGAEPAKARDRFIDQATFLERWQQPSRCFAVARRGDVVELFARPGFSYVVLGEFRDQILFANR